MVATYIQYVISKEQNRISSQKKKKTKKARLIQSRHIAGVTTQKLLVKNLCSVLRTNHSTLC